MTDQIIQWKFSQPTPPLHDPPHSFMTHPTPSWTNPPQPNMTHPPLHDPWYPFMTHPTPPQHDLWHPFMNHLPLHYPWHPFMMNVNWEKIQSIILSVPCHGLRNFPPAHTHPLKPICEFLTPYQLLFSELESLIKCWVWIGKKFTE